MTIAEQLDESNKLIEKLYKALQEQIFATSALLDSYHRVYGSNIKATKSLIEGREVVAAYWKWKDKK